MSPAPTLKTMIDSLLNPNLTLLLLLKIIFMEQCPEESLFLRTI